MRRSSGIPRQTGINGLLRVIRARTSPTTVSRVTESKGSLDETTTTQTDHTEDIWLYRPSEAIAEEIAGERINGSLGGLAIADGTVDLEHGDVVSHGGVEYDVDTIVGHPEDGEPGSAPETDLWIISFSRKQ